MAGAVLLKGIEKRRRLYTCGVDGTVPLLARRSNALRGEFFLLADPDKNITFLQMSDPITVLDRMSFIRCGVIPSYVLKIASINIFCTKK